MTIAAGFLCREGIVLCADTQETVSSYAKSNEEKIKMYFYGNLGLILSFAGAGSSEYIDTAIEKAMVGLHEEKTFEDVERRLEENLLKFYEKHLAIFPQSERPQVQLLIAASAKNGDHALFSYVDTSFHKTRKKAIGAGIILANSMIEELVEESETLQGLSNIAVYIIHRVKKFVDTCGGHTTLTVIKKGGSLATLNAFDVGLLEKHLRTVEIQSLNDLKEKIIEPRLKISWLNAEKFISEVKDKPDSDGVL